MARYTDKTPVTRAELEGFAQALRTVAAMVDGHVKTMAEAGFEQIEATHADTRDTAIKKLQAYVGAIQVAVTDQAFLAGRKRSPEGRRKPS